jgi:hypothetical protein
MTILVIAASVIGCNKDPKESSATEDKIALLDGSIFINKSPSANPQAQNSFPIGTADFGGAASISRSNGNSRTGDLPVNDYRFKLVNHDPTLTITADVDDKGDKPYIVQASHVVLSDNYAFVSYNHKHAPNVGGLFVYQFTVTHGNSLEEAKVDLQAITSLEMPNAQINAVHYDDNKLYIAGASLETRRNFFSQQGDYPAFLMVIKLDANRNFVTTEDPVVKRLTTFQATSVDKRGNFIYVTSADGTEGSKGGLHVFDATTYDEVHFEEMNNARSVKVADQGVYVMLAEPARLYLFDFDGKGGDGLIYASTNEAMQKDAKTEIFLSDEFIYMAQNETGLLKLDKAGAETQRLSPPNNAATCKGSSENCWYSEEDVTNSVWLNSDEKRFSNTITRKTDLLLLANGRQGIYWYDVAKDSNGESHIVAPDVNRIRFEGMGSANHIASKGNVVFLANGLDGLRVLYVGFSQGLAPPPVDQGACMKFMSFLSNVTKQNDITFLLPLGESVFRAEADPIIQQLFQLPDKITAKSRTLNYIEVEKETELFISLVFEGAGWNNALGYFVIPASVPKTDANEYAYFQNTIRPSMTTKFGTVDILKEEFDGGRGGVIFKHVRGEDPNLVRGNIYRIGKAGTKFMPGDRIVLFVSPHSYIPQNNHAEVSFNCKTFKQIFFMHKHFNIASEIPYHESPNYGDFAGCQFMSFFSADCKSMVIHLEDWHARGIVENMGHNGSDVDFNDHIFTILDNLDGISVNSFKLPYWTIGVNPDDNKPFIEETEEFLKKP